MTIKRDCFKQTHLELLFLNLHGAFELTLRIIVLTWRSRAGHFLRKFQASLA